MISHQATSAALATFAALATLAPLLLLPKFRLRLHLLLRFRFRFPVPSAYRLGTAILTLGDLQTRTRRYVSAQYQK
jgi:hypothetical protein